jgi:uncharacterized protein YbjT (DUF2867 family)
VKIALTTPTGHIGSQLANILLDRGAEITVIARHPQKVKNLAERGARVVSGELSDGAVVANAIQGADALFWVMPPAYTSSDPLGEARRFASAGARALSRDPAIHAVLLSSIGADRPSGTGPIVGLHDAEAIFRAVAKNVTALRPNYFMENVFNSLPTIVSDGNIYTSAGGSVTAPQIATRDIAEIAADVLLADGNGYRVIDLAGPEDFSLDREAEIISREIGRPIQVVTVPGEKMAVGMQQGGISPQMSKLFIEMEHAFSEGLTRDVHGDERRIGKTTYQQFVREVFVPAYKNANASVA